MKLVVSPTPWGHNIRLLQEVKDPEQRLWYAQKVFENGWSRNVLVMHIELEAELGDVSEGEPGPG